MEQRAREGRDAISTSSRQELGLTRGSIAEFLRGGGAEPLGSSADLQQVVFGDAMLNQGKIGGPIALGEDRLVLVKVTAHRKAEVKPLAQVHEEIVALLKQERGVAAAKAAAAALLPKLEAGEKLETLAPELKRHRRPGAVREPRRSVDSRPRCAPRSSKRRAPKENPWPGPPVSMTDPAPCSS